MNEETLDILMVKVGDIGDIRDQSVSLVDQTPLTWCVSLWYTHKSFKTHVKLNVMNHEI